MKLYTIVNTHKTVKIMRYECLQYLMFSPLICWFINHLCVFFSVLPRHRKYNDDECIKTGLSKGERLIAGVNQIASRLS